MSYRTIRSKFSIKIYVSNIEEHFLIVIFGPSIIDLKHNSYKEKKISVCFPYNTLKAKCCMRHKKDTIIKVKFLGYFPLNV